MSLLTEIQNAAVDSSTAVGDVLRRCKILAVRLGSAEFERWVDQELNGYESTKDVPEYRILRVHALGDFAGPYRSLKCGSIPETCLPENLRHWATTNRCKQSIASLEGLVRGNDKTIATMWPPEIAMTYGNRVYQDMECLRAWQTISKTDLVGIVENVRNRILQFVMEIERSHPDLAKDDNMARKVPASDVERAFHMVVLGNVQNVSGGDIDARGSVQVNVSKGDFTAVRSLLSDIGVPNDEIDALESAVGHDGPVETGQGFGPRVGDWFSKFARAASTGAYKVGMQAAVNILSEALTKYFGI